MWLTVKKVILIYKIAVLSPGAGGITQQASVIYTFSQGKKQSSCGNLLSDAKLSEPAIT